MKKTHFRPIIIAMAIIAAILLAGFVDSAVVFLKYASHFDGESLRMGISCFCQAENPPPMIIEKSPT